MSENDYIAEYVKERYPEVIHTVDYAIWKFGKEISNVASKFADIFANLGNNIYEEDQEDEILKN